jgi:uncharacterized protein
MIVFLGAAVVLAMLASLLLIPLGLPGLWLMVVIVMGLVLFGQLSWSFGLAAAVGALAAEVAEFFILKRVGEAYGGSRRAFWGAVLGGMVGLFVGFPIPIVGPVVTAFVGTFVGAGLVTFLETGSFEHSGRVGWGVVLARTGAVALKVAAGFVLIAAVALALIF